ncbi:MAG: AMP-binding protein [Desulfarculales bacterium]|jgi:acetyl-CoA synthetase|nr:AMP-binding protein [Desulfarculales bacterium]
MTAPQVNFSQSDLGTDYASYYRNFAWDAPENFNFAFDVVDRWAADRTKLALLSVGEHGQNPRYQSFHELSCLSSQVANFLRDRGLKKGDKALIMLQSIPEWYAVILGMFKLGVIPMPATVLLTAKDVAYRLQRSGAKLVVTDREHVERVEEALSKTGMDMDLKLLAGSDHEPLTPQGWVPFRESMEYSPRFARPVDTSLNDPLLIYFTSGTSGQPKMVLHTHGYAVGHYVTGKYVHGLRTTDLHWTVSETGWGKAAWGKLFGPMMVGAAVFQREAPGRFDPAMVFKLMERYGITTFCAPPTVYRMMAQLDLSAVRHLQLRRCLSAGEPLNPQIIEKWRQAFGLPVYDHYGQTETVAIVGNCVGMELRCGSAGKPTPGHDVRIVNEAGHELPAYEEGIIALYLGQGRPPGLMREYWKDRDLTGASIRNNYFYTGDRAYRDIDGYFWFVGRDDDVIKSSGYRIGPFEVESALIEHPAVMECAVVGAEDPDGTRGLLVKAFVVLAKDYKPSKALTAELQEHVRNTTAPYKYPRIVEYVNELPKTVSGKILRRQLRVESRLEKAAAV